MSELVKFSAGGSPVPLDTKALAKGLSGIAQGLHGTTTGLPFLGMKNGIFHYGQEKIEVEEGSLWAINPYSIQHGFACWGDGELLGEVMSRFDQPPPRQDELQDFGQPWAQQIGMQLKCIDGEDAGVTVEYKSTSIGMRNAAKALIDLIVQQAQNDPEHIVPVVELLTDSYHHKKYGEIFYPVLDPVEWMTMAGPDEAAPAPETDTESGEYKDQETKEPQEPEDPPPQAASSKSARKRRGNAAKSEQPTEGEGKPAQRRRRRRAS